MSLAKQFLLLIFLLLTCLESFAQDPQYIQYGINDGLPSPELYHSVVDNYGNIIIASDRGIAKYNGYEFLTYSIEDGLLDNTNFRIIKYGDELWFLGFNGKITIWDKGTFRPHPINEYVDTIANFTWWEDVIFINNKDYYLLENIVKGAEGKHTIGLYKGDTFTFHDELPGFLPINNEVRGRNELIGFPINDNYLMGTNNILNSDGSIRNHKAKYFIEPAERMSDDYFAFYIKFDFTRMKGEDVKRASRIFFFKDQEVVQTFESEKPFMSIFPMKGGSLWASSESGIHKFWLEQDSIRHNKYFNGLITSSVLEDNEGGYWVTTLGEGLMYIPSFNIYSWVESKTKDKIGFVTTFLVEEDQLYIGCKNGRLMKANDPFAGLEFLISSQNGEILDLLYHNGIYTSSLEYLSEMEDELKILNFDYWGRINSIGKNDKNEFIRAGGRSVRFSNLSQLEKGNIEPEQSVSLPHVITAVEILDSNCIYLGTLNGIYEVENTQLKTPYFSEKFVDIRISDVIATSRRELVIATMGYGITFVNDTVYTEINSDHGLSSDLINTCYLQNDSTLWVGTINGLDKLTFTVVEGKVSVKKIDHFSNQDGLISNFITEIVLWRDNIVVGTDKGISYFDVNFVPLRAFVSEVIVDSVYINRIKENKTTDFELNHFENDITIYYSATQFKKPRESKFYNCRLTSSQSKDTSWFSTDNRSITFSDLIPGKYIFEIYTSSNDIDNSIRQLNSIQFEIHPPFTQTLLFKFLVAGLLGLGIWFIIKQRERRIFEKNELVRIQQEHLLKLNNAQLTALRSQMNPHFIFNALNSIQNFVFKKDVRQANHFLTKFSNLIRKSLELSKLNVLPLIDELKFLNNYLELEIMRFPDHFDYEFHLPENWEERKIEVPSLLIQPILENSIRHGFKGIDYKGKLDIFIEDQTAGLKIKIVDNGIGLKASARLTSLKKHKSFAMNILENRIQMINELNGSEASYFTIKELENSNLKVQGVVVNLFIAKSKIND